MLLHMVLSLLGDFAASLDEVTLHNDNVDKARSRRRGTNWQLITKIVLPCEVE